MEKEIIIAIIAAGGSFVVAFISLVGAIITNRQAKNTQKSIETLKYDLGVKTSDKEFEREQFLLCLDGLDLAIQAIQRIKDDIYIFLYSVEDSLDADLALERINLSIDNLVNVYDSKTPFLNDHENKVIHKTKNKVIVLRSKVYEMLVGKEHVSELADEQKAGLIAIRNELTDAQNQIRDHRMTRISRRIVF